MDNNRTTVIACIDGSRHQDAVVDYASWVSRSVQAPVKFLHNIEERQTVTTDLSGSLGPGAREELLEELIEMENKRSRIMLEQGKIMLDNAQRRATEDGAVDIQKLQRHGGLTESLIELEKEIRVLVIGVRGEQHDEQERKLGAHLETVIRSLHRPILVVNQPFPSEPPSRCMLAYDGSEAADKALEMLSSSPLFSDMDCHLVHVSRDEESPFLQEPAARLEKAGLSVTTASLSGDVGPKLLDYQQQHAIGLTVMGAFGHSRLRELLFGSVTHRMLLESRSPLLLLR